MVTQMRNSEKKKEDWMNTKWRPMMGWSYMLTCVADFFVFPILWSLLQAMDKGSVTLQWQPITLQGAGLYHIAMGAVLGIAAFGRTQEKLGSANNSGPYAAPPTMPSTPLVYPSSTVAQTSAYTPPAGWGTAPVATGWGGKKAPPEADFPLL